MQSLNGAYLVARLVQEFSHDKENNWVDGNDKNCIEYAENSEYGSTSAPRIPINCAVPFGKTENNLEINTKILYLPAIILILRIH